MFVLLYRIVALFLFIQLQCIQSTTIDSNEDVEEESLWTQKAMELGHFVFPMPEDVFTDVMEVVAERYIPIHSNSDECRSHSQHLLDSFHQGHFWALRMVDSGSKLPSGVLDGNIQDLGSYKECVSVEEPQGLFRGQHCFVETQGLPVPPGLLLRRYGGPLDIRPSFSLCVPSSCSVADVTSHVNHVLKPVHGSVFPSDDLFDYVSCSTSQHPPFRLKDYVALIMFTLFGVFVIGSTLYNSSTMSVFSAGSLKRHWTGLLDTRIPPGELGCLNGLRVIMMITVVLQHRILMMYIFPNISNKTLTDFLSTFTMGVLELIPFKNVDGFFLIGGTVLSYSFFRSRQRQQPFNIIHFYIKRYFRLTPLLAVLVLYSATLQRYMSKGPVWSKISTMDETVCSEFGWLSLLYIDNYMDLAVTCVGAHWYIACDFQFHLLAPLVLIPLHRRPRTGLLLLGACCLASVAASIVNAYLRHHYSGCMLNMCVSDRPSVIDIPIDYTGIHFRAPGFLMGILLGYWLYNAIENNMRLSKQSLLVGWGVCVGTLVGLVCLSQALVHPQHQWSPWLDPLYIGLGTPAYNACLAWLIATCSLGHGGPLNTFLSGSIFRPLSRLTFGVYLLDGNLLILHSGSIQANMVFSFIDVAYYLMGDLVTSFAVATLCYLFIEKPCYEVVVYLLKDKKNGENSQQISELKLHTTSE